MYRLFKKKIKLKKISSLLECEYFENMNVIKSLKKNNFFVQYLRKTSTHAHVRGPQNVSGDTCLLMGVRMLHFTCPYKKKGKEKAQGEESENVRFFAQQQQQQQKRTHTRT